MVHYVSNCTHAVRQNFGYRRHLLVAKYKTLQLGIGTLSAKFVEL